MTALKDQRRLALPDVDPSIALALAARRDFERPTARQLIEQAKRDRARWQRSKEFCNTIPYKADSRVAS